MSLRAVRFCHPERSEGSAKGKRGNLTRESPNDKIQMADQVQISKSKDLDCFRHSYFLFRYCLGFRASGFEFNVEIASALPCVGMVEQESSSK